MNPDPKALLRTEMIVKVRAGLMTATAAAEALGVSRKTYYKWEKKGLQAMLAAGQNETAGSAGHGVRLRKEVKAPCKRQVADAHRRSWRTWRRRRSCGYMLRTPGAAGR
jgi:transposase